MKKWKRQKDDKVDLKAVQICGLIIYFLNVQSLKKSLFKKKKKEIEQKKDSKIWESPSVD